MSRRRQGPPITTFKPSFARFANAPETPEYQASIQRALINVDHTEALRLNQEKDPMSENEYLLALVGWTVCGVQDADPADPFSAPCLLLSRTGSGGNPGGPAVKSYKAAFVLRDPEGNGPGHLDICDADATAVEQSLRATFLNNRKKENR